MRKSVKTAVFAVFQKKIDVSSLGSHSGMKNYLLVSPLLSQNPWFFRSKTLVFIQTHVFSQKTAVFLV